MTAYYKDISGVKMDAKLLDIATNFVDTPKLEPIPPGAIRMTPASTTIYDETFKKLIDAVRDGGKVTSTEITTLEYINNTYFVQWKEQSALWALIRLLKMNQEKYDRLVQEMEMKIQRAVALCCDSD